MAAWTTPTAVADDDDLTAAFWNAQVRDNAQYLYDRLQMIAGVSITPQNFGPVGTEQQGAYIDVPDGVWLVAATVGAAPPGAPHPDQVLIRVRLKDPAGAIVLSVDVAQAGYMSVTLPHMFTVTTGMLAPPGTPPPTSTSALSAAGFYRIRVFATNLTELGGEFDNAKMTAIRLWL